MAWSSEPPSLSPGADGSYFCLTSWGPFQGLGGAWFLAGVWRISGSLLRNVESGRTPGLGSVECD